MNTPTTDKDKIVLEEFEQFGYSYMQRLFDRWKNRVYFNEMAKARLGCVLGYIIGLKHAGQEELAEKMAEDLDKRICQLSLHHNEFEVVTEGKDAEGQATRTVTKVPMRKCVVGDDGTWHGFALRWYTLLNPDVYQEHLDKARKECDEAGDKVAELRKKMEASKDPDMRKFWLNQIHDTEIFQTPHQLVVKRLQILERIDPHAQYSEELTEYRYIDQMQHRFYYVPGYNGGLIYHGPGAGETFTVNFGNGTLWGIHT